MYPEYTLKSIFVERLPDSPRNSMQFYWTPGKSFGRHGLMRYATSHRTLYGEKPTRHACNTNTGRSSRQGRGPCNSWSRVNNLAKSQSSSRSSPNSSQQNTSNGGHVGHLKQSCTTPPRQTTPTNRAASQNMPHCRIYCRSNQVPTQCPFVRDDVRYELIGLCNRNFSCWVSSLNFGQNCCCLNEPWTVARTPRRASNPESASCPSTY